MFQMYIRKEVTVKMWEYGHDRNVWLCTIMYSVYNHFRFLLNHWR